MYDERLLHPSIRRRRHDSRVLQHGAANNNSSDDKPSSSHASVQHQPATQRGEGVGVGGWVRGG